MRESPHLVELAASLGAILYLEMEVAIFPQEWQRCAASSAPDVHHQGTFALVPPGIYFERSVVSKSCRSVAQGFAYERGTALY